MAVHRSILHNISSLEVDGDKLFGSLNDVHDTIEEILAVAAHSTRSAHDISYVSIQTLKERQHKLSSMIAQCESRDENSIHSSIHATPKSVRSKIRSSLRKPRPKLKKTPLSSQAPPTKPQPLQCIAAPNGNSNSNHHTKKSEIAVAFNIDEELNVARDSDNNDDDDEEEGRIKVPRKKLFFANHTNGNVNHHENGNTTTTTNTNSNGTTTNTRDTIAPMELDLDTDSDNDENAAPIANLMSKSAKTMVQVHMERHQQIKKLSKPKQKIDALQKAQLKRLAQEKREQQRTRQKELARKQIEENKKKKKQQQQQQQQQQKVLRHASHKKFAKHNRPTLIAQQAQMQAQTQKPQDSSSRPAHKTSQHPPSKSRPHLKKRRLVPATASTAVAAAADRASNGDARPAADSPPPPQEYVLSDYDSNFSDSDLEEEKCGKCIPEWARKSNPKQWVCKQKKIDPDTVFGRMAHKSCQLSVIFKDYPSRTKYRHRSASGDWTRDEISFSEETAYKKQMGWLQ